MTVVGEDTGGSPSRIYSCCSSLLLLLVVATVVRVDAGKRPSRLLHSVVLEANDAKNLLVDAAEFLDSERWYAQVSAPRGSPVAHLISPLRPRGRRTPLRGQRMIGREPWELMNSAAIDC